MSSKHSIWIAAAALGAILHGGLLQAETLTAGAELRVNVNTEAKLRNPAIATTGDRFLVVWEHDRLGLRGRFFNPKGNPASAELALVGNQNLPGIPAAGVVVTRRDAAIAPLAKGGFLLFWTEERANLRVDHFYESREVIDRDVVGQRFTAAGAAVGSRFRVNADAAGFQSRPKALTLPSGDVAVAFDGDDRQEGVGAGDGVFARIVNASGRAVTGVFKVNSDATLPANSPALAADARGNLLITWEAGHDREIDVYARLFDRNGVPRIPDFRVNSDVAGLQRRPAVTADPTGGFLVVWQGQFENWRKSRIYGQFLGAGGNLLGPQFQVSSGYGLAQISPSVVPAPERSFLVTWVDYDTTFPLGLAAVRIDGSGNARGEETWLNQQPLGAQSRTAVATRDGRALIPYEGYFNRAQGINARPLAL